MTENTSKTEVSSFDGKGALWTIAGTGIAIAASKLVNGGFGGVLGGGNVAAQAANTAVAIEMAKKDSEIALLKANAETDVKLSDVFKTLRQLDKEQDAKLADINTRVTTLETSAPLREKIVLDRVDAVATLANNGIATNTAAINALAATVGGITKIVVPRTAVCPEPMPRYNSWTTPTCDTPTPA